MLPEDPKIVRLEPRAKSPADSVPRVAHDNIRPLPLPEHPLAQQAHILFKRMTAIRPLFNQYVAIDKKIGPAEEIDSALQNVRLALSKLEEKPDDTHLQAGAHEELRKAEELVAAAEMYIADRKLRKIGIAPPANDN